MKSLNLLSCFIIFLLASWTLTGCNAIQPILVLRPSDLFWIPFIYIFVAFVISYFISIERKQFWLWFALNIVFTPILGVILIIRMIKNKNS